MTAALFTRYGDTPLTITREDLLPGMVGPFWVMEPIGRYLEPDTRGNRMTHPLPCHAGLILGEVWTRVVQDLDTLEVVE